jgi:hypothetical protein
MAMTFGLHILEPVQCVVCRQIIPVGDPCCLENGNVACPPCAAELAAEAAFDAITPVVSLCETCQDNGCQCCSNFLVACSGYKAPAFWPYQECMNCDKPVPMGPDNYCSIKCAAEANTPIVPVDPATTPYALKA